KDLKKSFFLFCFAAISEALYYDTVFCNPSNFLRFFQHSALIETPNAEKNAPAYAGAFSA
ncbi:hypothetical protein RQP54_02655, partial [Curvibacter sp. APW13]|uniref:hypothetical protein n=1 Tax=Curvibacter sp. APW13 TaxID=3077236 RepID=UPI0028DF8B0B